MNFRSFGDMNRTIVQNLHKVNSYTDLIVGIPRSGLMAANILAMHLNLPIADTSKIYEGQILLLDGSINGRQVDINYFKNILVIDDSVRSGRSIEQVKAKLHSIYPDINFTFAAVYADTKSKNKVDLYFELCPVPRVFEWNIMNHFQISKFCMEIDGVLCENIDYDYNDNHDYYIHAIENVRPMFRIRREIGYLVTRRPEILRRITEKWLDKHGIKYRNLIMQDKNMNECKMNSDYINKSKSYFYKKQVYSRVFIESSFVNSCKIAQFSGKLVYSIDKGIIVRPSWLSEKKQKINDNFMKLAKKLNDCP